MPTLFDLYGIDLGQPDEPPPPPKSGLIRRAVGDTAVSAVKGAIAIPEAAVGLASIFTGGQAGKVLENDGGLVGFRPKQAREFLDTLYSPEQQAANREVQQAEGFIDTADAALRNPSTIAHAVVESAPSMLGAAGAARGLMAVASKVNPLVAVGAGEGIFSAGSAAEQIRQQTDDGRLTAEQSLIAAGSGALTGLIGGVAGKIANKLGIGDVQQMLAGVQQAGPKAEKALTRALLEGFATEGILQELPQSAQEQIAQNVALGRPWDEGVGNAAAMGTLAGGVMGVGGAAIGRLQRQPEPVDPLAEGNARADAAMERLATTNDVGQMIEAAREIATATPLQPLAISPEQEARVMQAGEELAQADLTDIKNMGRLDRTRSPEPPAPSAPIIPASEEGPAPFLDRLLTATEALQDPAVRQRVEQAAGPQYLAQLDQYAEVANTPGVMDGVGDQVRDRYLGLLERAVFPDRFRQPAPAVPRAERRKSDPVPIEPFRVEPFATDPVLDYVDAKRGENTPAARMFVKEFEAGRITRRDVVRVMQDRNADPLGSNPDPLASIQPATPAPNLIQQRLEAAARAGQAQPTGIQIEPSRARPKGQSDERNPERAVPGAGRPVDTGNQPGTSGVVSGELQQPGAPGPAGAPVPIAVQGVDAERAGRGLGDDALSGERVAQLAAVFKRVADQKHPGRDNSKTAQTIAAELNALIEAKNADALIGRNLGSADMNPASRAVFEAATGVKLPKGRAATEAAIDQWAGVTPEVRAEREAKRKALRESKKADDASKFARQAAERIQVNTPDGQVMGGAYVDDLISRGFDRIVARGPKTFLANSDGNGFPLPNVDLAGYARKAVAAREKGSAQAQAVPVGGFDSEAWDKARSERIEASRSAGNVHLDKVPAYVETMRGKRIYYVHDEKVQGVIRTVDNRGNVYVDWADSYSADKELASPVQEGRKTVFRSSIGTRDLKDYALKSAKAPQVSAQAQAGTPAEGAGTTRPMPGQANQQDRLRDARAIGRQASEEGKPRSPPHAFTTLEKQVWRAGWDEAKATKGAVPQVPTKPADQAAILPLDQAANEAATSPSNDLPEPTEAQQAAGNYKVGRIKVAGLDISVENPAGSERSGIDPDGKKWRNKLAHHYGYIRRSEGADGDHVDVFVNPGTPEDYDGQVFVVDQADPKTGRFDEHKVMMGFPSAKAAQEAYQANYAKDWTGLRAVQPMTMEQFKAWVSDPANTKKPAAKGVKPGKGEKVERPDELVELRKRESALKSLRECLG